MSNARTEAIANADAHTHDVGLPTYTELQQALAYLNRQVAFSDLPPNNGARLLADKTLARIPA